MPSGMTTRKLIASTMRNGNRKISVTSVGDTDNAVRPRGVFSTGAHQTNSTGCHVYAFNLLCVIV